VKFLGRTSGASDYLSIAFLLNFNLKRDGGAGRVLGCGYMDEIRTMPLGSFGCILRYEERLGKVYNYGDDMLSISE